MASIKELIAESENIQRQMIQQKATDLTYFSNESDVFSFIEKGLKQTFIKGNRNNYLHAFASEANRFGINENDAINYFLKYVTHDFSNSEIQQVVKSAYRRPHEHGTKEFRKYSKSEKEPNESKEIASKEKSITQSINASENIFLIRTANQCIDSAKNKPIPPKLFYEFWFEGELCILFASTGVGKTILAMQIADEISKIQKVLYFDFELSEKQFEKRYSDNFQDHYVFYDNFLRIEIDQDAENFSDEGLRFSIEQSVIQTKAKILIVDNITYLRSNLETSKDALPLMKHLKMLKKRHNLSILCLAHTPKRDQTRPITINDLSGSTQLANFTDSIFCINWSTKDASLRYIKQIKARFTENVYNSDNVMVCEVRNDINFTRFHFIDFGKEVEHLKEQSENEKTELENAVLELKKSCPEKSIREIAAELKTNKSRVERILKKYPK